MIWKTSSDERSALASSLEQEDATSVKLMVKNMQDGPHDPVLIFKPVGDEMNGYKKIGTEEFMLAIMNDQEKLLELYESSVGETSVETRREDLEHSNHNLVLDENYNEKHEIEKDAIVPTLHNISLDAEIHNTVTVLKNLERRLKNVKSVDEVCRIKRSPIALERSINSSERMTNLSGLPVAQLKVACAPSNKTIEQQRFVTKKRKLSKQNRSCLTDIQKHQKQE
ncbi:hypothetical protein NPIL_641361 [Nephila pilipes]|uniref:Uncharacterized protein n=1 Tax=Nephila pilipes TaxID=299642 RepID=A0A8X6MSB1_NEPPI|nr:hypothetical protein NPIL_641361 [Nephila pilipes]